MRKFRQRERRWALVKTIISCIGWGLLGCLIMTTYEELSWLGWVILTAAACVGVGTVDKLIELW